MLTTIETWDPTGNILNITVTGPNIERTGTIIDQSSFRHTKGFRVEIKEVLYGVYSSFNAAYLALSRNLLPQEV